MPIEAWLSQVCEQFHCTPSVAMAEPMALLNDVLAWRRYVLAREAVDRMSAEDNYEPPEWAYVLVTDVKERIYAERKQRREAADDDEPSPSQPVTTAHPAIND